MRSASFAGKCLENFSEVLSLLSSSSLTIFADSSFRRCGFIPEFLNKPYMFWMFTEDHLYFSAALFAFTLNIWAFSSSEEFENMYFELWFSHEGLQDWFGDFPMIDPTKEATLSLFFANVRPKACNTDYLFVSPFGGTWLPWKSSILISWVEEFTELSSFFGFRTENLDFAVTFWFHWALPQKQLQVMISLSI